MPTALITGASRGLGLALGHALANRGWALIIDARRADALGRAHADLQAAGARSVTSIAGDVGDAAHRRELAAAAAADGLDLLVNNASVLGPSPLQTLATIPLEVVAEVYAVNVLAPLGLTQLVLSTLREYHGIVINITSDAAVEPYEGWGGYGSSKAALDQVSAIQAAEVPSVPVYAFDPGDMRTALHQQAYPGEDISDRPEPETVVPALLRLVDERPPSGRYQASRLAAAEALR
jgi:NAD(P)-dependent dehydrogenase (short-subunit alcohol dehydrogenase family)